eukprot:scaffold4409_cov369-Prasinococcus_capsulatus_cf.AAC.6
MTCSPTHGTGRSYLRSGEIHVRKHLLYGSLVAHVWRSLRVLKHPLMALQQALHELYPLRNPVPGRRRGCMISSERAGYPSRGGTRVRAYLWKKRTPKSNESDVEHVLEDFVEAAQHHGVRVHDHNVKGAAVELESLLEGVGDTPEQVLRVRCLVLDLSGRAQRAGQARTRGGGGGGMGWARARVRDPSEESARRAGPCVRAWSACPSPAPLGRWGR